MENCFFCKEALERGIVITETDNFYARLSDVPLNPGSFHIITKEHKESFFELDSKEWSELRDIIEKGIEEIKSMDLERKYQKLRDDVPKQKFVNFIEDALESEFLDSDPDGYNLGINEGRAAGRSIDHFHLHVIPRFEGDVDEKRYGIRNIFPEKADYE
ncbi:MAG: HIT family protein [Candidatus Nanohaloarchaea archaeon]